MYFKSGCFLVKTFTVAVWQRLLLLLTKQRWDFSREAMDSEFVKLLSPALKPERGVEINICIFILLLLFSNGALQTKRWPLLCTLGVCRWGKSQSFIKCRILSHFQTEKCLTSGGAELIRHSPSHAPSPAPGCNAAMSPWHPLLPLWEPRLHLPAHLLKKLPGGGLVWEPRASTTCLNLGRKRQPRWR